ncbi:MAG: hypothetical protein LH606_15355 [Cytophagaceae bacterium]|nr:hypothetical protein [Cytophagaceae bacterium]
MSTQSKVSEFFNFSTSNPQANWGEILQTQPCGYLGRKCVKVRKSSPEISIGTCTVRYGSTGQDVIICPHRLVEKRKIFLDCLHLLTLHEPGNELHVVSEISIPGGSVDYFLVSARHDKVIDFVGIELQTMDTTGTVWPERQRFLAEIGLLPATDQIAEKSFGMNWKMTAKTILVQLHHKIQTFEHLGKRLVLVVQDHLLNYVQREFSFGHVHTQALLGDSMHFHAYGLAKGADNNYHLGLKNRCSTDSDGIALCLGLQAQARVELEIIVQRLEAKLSQRTLLTL